MRGLNTISGNSGRNCAQKQNKTQISLCVGQFETTWISHPARDMRLLQRIQSDRLPRTTTRFPRKRKETNVIPTMWVGNNRKNNDLHQFVWGSTAPAAHTHIFRHEVNCRQTLHNVNLLAKQAHRPKFLKQDIGWKTVYSPPRIILNWFSILSALSTSSFNWSLDRDSQPLWNEKFGECTVSNTDTEIVVV